MTHYNDFLGKLILSQHSFYSSARPCGIAHAQIHCHPKTKSKVRPKKKPETLGQNDPSHESQTATISIGIHWGDLQNTKPRLWSSETRLLFARLWISKQSLYSLGFHQRYWQGIPTQSKRHPISGGSMRTKFSCSIWNGLEFLDCGF